MARHDFSVSTIRHLAQCAGYKCSRPDCSRPTIGPSAAHDTVVNLGVAAHITAASEKGPRYNVTLTQEQRESWENGLWLCQTCSRLIDVDPKAYPVELLVEWRTKRNAAAHAELTGAAVAVAPVDGVPVLKLGFQGGSHQDEVRSIQIDGREFDRTGAVVVHVREELIVIENAGKAAAQQCAATLLVPGKLPMALPLRETVNAGHWDTVSLGLVGVIGVNKWFFCCSRGDQRMVIVRPRTESLELVVRVTSSNGARFDQKIELRAPPIGSVAPSLKEDAVGTPAPTAIEIERLDDRDVLLLARRLVSWMRGDMRPPWRPLEIVSGAYRVRAAAREIDGLTNPQARFRLATDIDHQIELVEICDDTIAGLRVQELAPSFVSYRRELAEKVQERDEKFERLTRLLAGLGIGGVRNDQVMTVATQIKALAMKGDIAGALVAVDGAQRVIGASEGVRTPDGRKRLWEQLDHCQTLINICDGRIADLEIAELKGVPVIGHARAIRAKEGMRADALRQLRELISPALGSIALEPI